MIRRYLLGELTEAEQTAFEWELLADHDKFEQVCEIENELIDSYMQGEMKGADLERFEGHYFSSSLHRERAAIAETLLVNIDQTVEGAVGVSEEAPTVPWWSRVLGPRGWPLPVFGVAIVLASLLIFGVIWSYLEKSRLTGEMARLATEAEAKRAALKQREQELVSRNQELGKEIADERRRGDGMRAELKQLRRRAPSTSAAVVSFLLTPASERSEETPPPFRIPLITEKVRLLMALEGNGYADYRVKLQTAEGQDILSRQSVKVELGRDRTFVALTIRARELARGDYVLILLGQTPDGRSEEINRYFFQAT
jgi:hypothetical protein